jgi:hypothetical protein
MNSDLNASNNIARRVGYRVEVRRILSYIVTHNGLRPITLLRGNARDPSGGNPALKGGGGVITKNQKTNINNLYMSIKFM